MNFDNLKSWIKDIKFDAQDVPTGAAVLIGIVLLALVFKSGKVMMKVLALIIAVGLFAGAYWWHSHK